jgi:hypothetical protein
MKLAKIGFAAAALAMVLCSRPELSWASRMFTAVVSGEVTAIPYAGKIEVDHHTYVIKVGSPAEQASHNVSVGDVVDLVLDAPATEKGSTVIAINKHSGTK